MSPQELSEIKRKNDTILRSGNGTEANEWCRQLILNCEQLMQLLGHDSICADDPLRE